MSEKSENTILNQSMLFVGDSPARTLALPDYEKASKGAGRPYGKNFSESFAKLNQDGLWLKMYGDCFQVTMENSLETFFGTWPDAGFMSNGKCFHLQSWARHTKEKGSLLLPTPTASDSQTHPNDMIRFDSLTSFLHRKYGRGLLNPRFVEWMMGYPSGWTQTNNSVTP